MKNLIVIFTLLTTHQLIAENCVRDEQTKLEDVVHVVDTSIPAHLKGAKITVTLADGRSSTVAAEQFMVVPRKQRTVVGQNKSSVTSLVCRQDSKKNILMLEARKDVTDLDVETVSKTANVYSERSIVPGLNYYRRELMDSAIGAGIGVDANGTVKGMIGTDF